MANGSTIQLLPFWKQWPPFPLCHCLEVGTVGWHTFQANCRAKKPEEGIFTQVACHVPVTSTGKNNSRVPSAPPSTSSHCLSHAPLVDSGGNLLGNTGDKASRLDRPLRGVGWGASSVWIWLGLVFIWPRKGRHISVCTRQSTMPRHIHLFYTILFCTETSRWLCGWGQQFTFSSVQSCTHILPSWWTKNNHSKDVGDNSCIINIFYLWWKQIYSSQIWIKFPQWANVSVSLFSLAAVGD